ncbi:hypothetical protein A5756_05185 [Mycobacterium sp. 852002-53434_SCH5985345]|nr:hypothetical protein A5756_05185 [Mycobacterium sp. 852002-53434_SCH5985345]OBF70288.1 hypothetical protein A5750_22020 [Mycobacterium sp. 852002-51613_SCH5001154]
MRLEDDDLRTGIRCGNCHSHNPYSTGSPGTWIGTEVPTVKDLGSSADFGFQQGRFTEVTKALTALCLCALTEAAIPAEHGTV